MKYYFLLLSGLLILSLNLPAQEYNIVPYLKQIEQGETSRAEEFINAVGSDHNNPTILFLDAVLTVGGENALEKYMEIYDKYPSSPYADAALYRVFSYYYSLGYYKRAESYLQQLKEFYPSSPYIKIADRNIPDDELEIAEEPAAGEITEAGDAGKKTYSFTVQAGAFLNLQNAKRLKTNIENEGLMCEIKTKEVGGSILNVVLVGQFEKREETAPVIELLKNRYNITGRIASITN